MNGASPAASLPTANAVHIVCSVYDGSKHLVEFLKSLQAQTVSNWTLWVRNDGSRDNSGALLQQFAAGDERIAVIDVPAHNMGVVASYNLVLRRVPADARYIMFADQDDVWLPRKIEDTLSAMLLGEEHSTGPILVHTDMHVVNEQLDFIAESFWKFARINPEATSIQRLLTRNVVTGATMMVNRALRERAGDISPNAAMHDWWMACVASVFGRLIAVTTPTMQYRQHASNVIGARRPGSAVSLVALPLAAVRGVRQRAQVRKDISAAARQAGAFLAQFGDELCTADREFVAAYAGIPNRMFFGRKFAVARLHLHREDGWLKNAGLLLRA